MKERACDRVDPSPVFELRLILKMVFITLSILYCSLVPHLAHPPFRLRLENVHGMNPSIDRTFDWWKDVDTFISSPTRRSCTVSGHILVAQPMTHNIHHNSSGLHFGSLGTVCFTDTIYLFQSSVPCFTCFLTKKVSSNGYAVRIQDTCIWLLISDVFGLVECNECSCKLNRNEFKEIQSGFLRLLL
jgi:hypothetical protein